MSALETAVVASESLPATSPPVLLLVGDPNRLNIAREALVELELGWEVVFAQNGFEAQAVPGARAVDVILIDLGDPLVEGVELTESLAARFPQVPIVLMSAPYAVSVALEAVRKGGSGHFPRDLLDTEPAAVLETLRTAARDGQLRRAAALCADNQYFEFTIHNDRSVVPAVVRRLSDAAVEVGLCDRLAAVRVGVALEEAIVNAIVHGNLEVSSDLRQEDESRYGREIEARRTRLPFADRRVRVTARVSRTEGVFVVQDDGPGFDISRIPDPTGEANIMRVGGRGILLMRAFMSSVHFNEAGNRVTLVKRR
jgi:CheY-like chemotaxis protein/anti-sigma regulatory factor (Ser/Thr protein kinase)